MNCDHCGKEAHPSFVRVGSKVYHFNCHDIVLASKKRPCPHCTKRPFRCPCGSDDIRDTEMVGHFWCGKCNRLLGN